MADYFTHGYALLIGVGVCAYPNWSLPTTAQDVCAIHSILTDKELCAYPDNRAHTRLLHDDKATRKAILDGLSWLQEQAAADPEATVVVYYSGHGWLNHAGAAYYLIPHDVLPFDIPGSALSAGELSTALRQVCARRLLVFMDCCHAEGMATAKALADKDFLFKLPPGLAETALPQPVAADLKQGEGRAVFSASRGTQRSWVRPDGEMSVYTYHLIEALQGAGSQPGERLVRLSNLMNHLNETVPRSAQTLCQAEQTPFFDMATEDFPVTMLRGGKGLPAGGWDTIRHKVDERIEREYHAELHGSGAIAQGPGAAAASAGGIAVGRNVHGGIAVGGDQNAVARD